MERRTISIGGRRIAYLAGTTSWHPTFEVVFVARAGGDRRLEDIARALASYANVYILDIDALGRRGDAVGRLAAWTSATSVRRPVFATKPDQRPVAVDFARRYPQFTLGVVEVPPDDTGSSRGAIAGLAQVISKFASLRLRALRPMPRAEVGLRAPEAQLPDGPGDRQAEALRRFAATIKPESPANQRLPSRIRQRRLASNDE